MPSAAALERRPRQTANSPQGHQTALNAPSQSSSISEPSRRKRPVNNLGDWDHDNDEMLTSGLPNSRRKRRRSGPPKAGDTCDGALASQMTLACPSEIDCCSDSACDLSIISHEPHSNSCSLILCLNPDECDQEDCCTDEACNHPCEFDLRQSYPSSKENDLTNTCHGNLVDFHNFDSLESNESIPCQWLETDHQCSAFGPPAALSQHVFKDHIEQNTLLPCGWAQCDQTVDSQQLLQHVAKAHQPDQYVCLWQGCGCSFSSDEELAAHMSAMHCTKLDCHWGGCELFGLDPVALKSHVFDDHINFHPSDTFNPLPYSGEFFTSSSAPSLQNNTRPSSSSSTSNLASQHSHAQLSLPQVEPMVNDSEKHSCFWTLETMTNSICAASFANENDLQAHIEKDHLSDLSSRTSPLGTAVFVCKWRGCKSKGTPHNGKDKLRKHTYTHTGCTFDFEALTLLCLLIVL